MYRGDIRLEDTVDLKFTSRRFSTGAPFALVSGVISAYVGNSTTQITAGITLTADFDGVTGLNNVRVVATAANGYTAATNVDLVITTGTVDSVSVVGEVIGSFSIEARSALMPTTVARKLDVSATGEAGIDWANIGSPTTAQNLSATNIDVDQIVASVSGAVGSVTGAVASVTGAVTVGTINASVITATSIAADAITAAKVADGTIDANTFAAGAINAAAIAADAITDAKVAADVTIASVTGAVGSVTGAVGSVTGNVGGNVVGSVASVTGNVGGNVTGSVGSVASGGITSTSLAASALTAIRSVVSGTSDSGSTTTMVDAARTEADTDWWKGSIILFTSGTIAGQSRLITAFNAATDTITFTPATTATVGTQTYEILPNGQVEAVVGAVGSVTGAVGSVTGAVGSVTGNVGGNVVGSVASVTAAVTVGTINANVITATSIQADAITAAKVADGTIDANTFAAGAINAAAIAADAITAAKVADGTIDAATFAAGAINAAAIAADAITDAKVAADVTIASVTGAVGSVTGNVGGNVVGSVGSIATGGIAAASFAAGAIDAAAIAADAIGSSELAASAVTEIQSGLATSASIVTLQADTDDIQTRLPAALVSGRIDASVGAMAAGVVTAAAVATGAIDADALATDAVTEIRSVVSGTSDSGSTTTMVDAARTEADTDYWKGAWILFTSGTISGQCRQITAFNAATDTITFAPATTQTVGTQTYEILPAGAVDVRLWNGTAPSDLIAGRVDSNVQAMAAGVITAAVVATDAIDSDAIAASAVTEIQTGLATSAALATVQADTDDIQTRLPAALVSGRIDASVGAMAAGVVTAAAVATGAIDADALATDAVSEIADGVWDEVLAGHLTAGTTGAALNAAGSAGDPWSTALPGAYGAGTAGKIVGDNINATISSRATQTSVDAIDDFVDTEIADIQARLPAALVSGRMDSSVGAMAANVLTASAIAADAITAAKVADGTIDAATFAAGAINAAAIATDAIDADAIAASAVTEIQSGLATAAALATVDGIVDDILLDTAEIGAAGAGLTNINLPNQSMDIVGNITGNLSGSVGSVTGNVGGNVTGSVGSVATGGISAASFAAGAIDNAAIATDAIGANELAASAVAEIQSGLATSASFTLLPAQVWDYGLAGSPSPGVGSAGYYLLAAGAGGDPWTTPLPGAYGAGTAGNILGTNLNATISSRATQASVDVIDAIVDSILVDTAEIGAAGAGLTAIPWNAAWDAEVQSEATDALNAYDPPTNAEMDARTLVAANYATATALDAVDNFVDTEISAIKAVTDKIDPMLQPGAGSPSDWRFTVEALENAPSGSGSSPASIADAVWDEARAGHVVAGSFGEGVASVQGNVTGNVGGNVTGSVGSVVGAVGSVTGNVGGNVVGTVGSVVGAVASVTGGVTVTTNNDKTGYTLSAAGNASVADKILGRHIAGGSDVTGLNSRNVTSALRSLRNYTNIAGGVLTVREEDDATTAWTATVATTAGDPLSAIDPA